ncbi:MAG: glycine oxidase ThiO [Candidatus Latescibacterota bacterium]
MSAERGVVVVGAGCIGLGIGWQLAKAGCRVAVYDRQRAGRGASWASAGMLSPLTEAHLAETDLVHLGLASAALYPEWVAELEEDSGVEIGYRRDGALKIALDRDDAAQVRHLFETQQRLGLEVEWLRGAEAREREPLLSPRVTAAIWCAADHQVDNRRMLEALVRAYGKAGGVLCEEAPVERVEVGNGRARAVHVGGQRVEADIVVVAAGCWSATLDGLPEEVRPPVRPVKGQILAVRMGEGVELGKVIWAPDAYLVPKGDGRLVIGATSEEKGFDTSLTAGGLYSILRGAWEAVPGIYDMPVLETWAGLRPGSRDSAPVLGTTSLEGLLLAAGHFRKGILLTPVTARDMASLVLTGRTPERMAPFRLSRFAGKG